MVQDIFLDFLKTGGPGYVYRLNRIFLAVKQDFFFFGGCLGQRSGGQRRVNRILPGSVWGDA